MNAVRQMVAIALIFSLAPRPTSARSGALGVIVYCDGAHLGDNEASEGTTLYDGDQLSTEDHGELRVHTQTARLQLAGESRVTLHLAGETKNTEADLLSGTLVFSVAQASGLEVHADEARIRPAADAPTIAHVRIVGPKELRIFARRGALTFSYRGESREIPESAAYRVLLDPAENDRTAEAEKDQNGKKAGRHHLAFVFLAIGVAAALAAIPFFRNPESPDKP